jgi:predicted RNA binding protein YcfA (HicA-like mRNA interferase family)
MVKLPIVSGTEAVKALQRLGFFVDRQRGSHAVLKKVTPQGERGCVIPMHREVALGTLRSALKWQASRPKNSRMPCDCAWTFVKGVIIALSMSASSPAFIRHAWL